MSKFINEPADFDLFVMQSQNCESIVICQNGDTPFIELRICTFVITYAFGEMMGYTVRYNRDYETGYTILSRPIQFKELRFANTLFGMETFETYVECALSMKKSGIKVLFV